MDTARKSSPAHQRKLEQARSGAARAALLGISDGLVTNVSLILGVAAAGAAQRLVQLAGLASLIAGALSMAVGEYLSMRGQTELLESVLEAEHQALRENPEATHHALEKILRQDGVSAKTAHTASIEIGNNPEQAMTVYTRGALGIDPGQLGSAWSAAISSLVTFAIGALVPLLPWFFGAGAAAVFTSLGLAVVAAAVIGGYLGLSTNGQMLRAAARQILMLILAASCTYIIGRLFHTTVS